MPSKTKIFVTCPVCFKKVDHELFLFHVMIDHDLEASSLKEINDRFVKMGYDPLEFEASEEDLSNTGENNDGTFTRLIF